MGEACPLPTSTLHAFWSFSGHALGAENEAATPSRAGPRHCGQSAAPAALALKTAARTAAVIPIDLHTMNPPRISPEGDCTLVERRHPVSSLLSLDCRHGICSAPAPEGG